MALGEILRNARVQKGLTPSDVAESTHMLVQVVESLEQEDFRRIAAPIYGRGFVKLYAEMLGLDPEPLVNDFMYLYSGARPPAVLTKKMAAEEPAPEPDAAGAPVTRTVSDATLQMPRPKPPRPAVRTVPLTDEDAPDSEGDRMVDAEDAETPFWITDEENETEGHITVGQEPDSDVPHGCAVEPEEPYAPPPDEPDLFHPLPAHRQAEGTGGDGFQENAGRPATSRKRRFPVFQIGGRLEKNDAEEPRSEEAHARRQARIQAFMDGLAKLKNGMGRHLPEPLHRKRVWLVGCAGLVIVAMMVTGISLLFKLTGTDAKADSSAKAVRIAPPPPLYVD